MEMRGASAKSGFQEIFGNPKKFIEYPDTAYFISLHLLNSERYDELEKFLFDDDEKNRILAFDGLSLVVENQMELTRG